MAKNSITSIETPEEEKLVSHVSNVFDLSPVVSFDRFSSFHKLLRVTAWIYRFISNCKGDNVINSAYLLVSELHAVKQYWNSVSQADYFSPEIKLLRSKSSLPKSSSLLPLHPFLDDHGLLRVGGRLCNSSLSFLQRHPIILHQKHPITRMIIHTEHIQMLHAGPTLLVTSLSCRYHILGLRKAAHFIIKQCVICRRQSAKPEHQLMGQLPLERVNPDIVLRMWVLTMLVPSNQNWSDHGTNFVGTNCELKEFNDFLSNPILQHVSQFCSSKGIDWRFIPERAPHFGLWESTVKSMKIHLTKVTTNMKLTYEEASTVLTQIEACLSSRPLSSIASVDKKGIEILTPGHFLIGRLLTAVPDPPSSYNQSITLLWFWQLCRALLRHFWKRWSAEYLNTVNRLNKWRFPTCNIEVGDVVLMREDNTGPTQWPLAHVTSVYRGQDGFVRVVKMKTSKGEYNCPISKVILLLPNTDTTN